MKPASPTNRPARGMGDAVDATLLGLISLLPIMAAIGLVCALLQGLIHACEKEDESKKGEPEQPYPSKSLW